MGENIKAKKKGETVKYPVHNVDQVGQQLTV
jgi:hypothetical protein